MTDLLNFCLLISKLLLSLRFPGLLALLISPVIILWKLLKAVQRSEQNCIFWAQKFFCWTPQCYTFQLCDLGKIVYLSMLWFPQLWDRDNSDTNLTGFQRISVYTDVKHLARCLTHKFTEETSTFC